MALINPIGGGISSDNFTDATYLIVIETAIPYSEEFEGGEFPQLYTWSGQIGSTDKASWFQVETNIDDNYEISYTDVLDGDAITIDGDMDINDSMTIKINVDDLYNEVDDTDNASLKLTFKGTVLDGTYSPM